MTRANVQKLSARKMARLCGPNSLVFLILNTCLIIGYICISHKGLTRKVHKYYSAYANRDQFMNAIAQFTTLSVADRIIEGRNFPTSKDLGDGGVLLRFFITDYLKFHQANQANGTRRLIYRPGEVGNGDRFNYMVFAYSVAVLSRRVFLLDWDEPFPLSHFLESASGAKLFLDPSEKNRSRSPAEQCTSPSCTLLASKNLNNYEAALRSKTRTVFMYSNRMPLMLSDAFVQEHIPESIPTITVESFRKSVTFRRAVLHHVLKLSDSMVRDHKRIARKMRLTSGIMSIRTAKRSWWSTGLDDVLNRSARKYIGVHARLGKGVGEFPSERFNTAVQRMKDMAKCLASRAVRLSLMSGSPPVPIFLATDTAEFRDVFKKVVNQISSGRVDVVFGNWSMVHVAKVPLQYTNHSRRGHGELWESVWGGFMDLVLLGHAEHIVALYSGFPRLAMSIGDAETLVELRNAICLEQ